MMPASPELDGASGRRTVLLGLVTLAALLTVAWFAWRGMRVPEGRSVGDAPRTATQDRPAATPETLPEATATVVLAAALDALGARPAELYGYARRLESEGRPLDAGAAFARYAEVEPALADVAWMAVGNNRFEAGDFAGALEAFTRARDAAFDPATGALAALRRGNALLRVGPPELAIGAYEEAFAAAVDDAARSQALAGLIAAQLDAGRPDEATATRLRLVRELPGTALAPAALARLRDSGVEVSPAEEAAVLAGAGDPVGALARLAPAVAADPVHPADWSLDMVRWSAAAGDPARAVAVADAFLSARGDDPLAGEVAWERARALARLGQQRDAAAAYGELADRWPEAERAPEALLQRAWMLLSLDGPAVAAPVFEALATRYPASDSADDARFRAGLSAWRSGDLPAAARHWSVLVDGAGGFDQARAAYWLGRAARDAGAVELAERHFRTAAGADPTGYYGLRGAEALGEAPPDAGTAAGGACDAELARWLSAWGPPVDAAGVAAARAALRERRDVRRGTAWLALGERSAALTVLRAANRAAWGEAITQTLLAEAAHDLGLYDVSTSAAAAAIAAAPPRYRLAAPVGLARLAYPDAFGDLVRPAAAANDVPPAVFFALILQESRFEPTARSSVGATGLTQVMPGTGEGIAAALGEAFTLDRLEHPEHAIRYGAHYLAGQLDRFDGDVPVALAAYNGGPGNAVRWADAAGGDADLFMEVIDFRETRLYVRLVAERAMHYRRLYPDLR